MIRYEGLLLTTPQITQEEIANIESAIDKIIQSSQGSLISFERWGKYKLAYPIKKNDYGVYILIRFDVPEGNSVINDMKMAFETKMNTIVMRTLFTRLDNDQPLAYQRPKSLEEMPARESEFSHRERGDRDRDRDRGDRPSFYSSQDKDELSGKYDDHSEM